MRKTRYIFIVMMLAIGTTVFAHSSSEDQQLRDSIFRTYRSLTEPNDRINYMYASFYGNIDKKWSVDILDTIMPTLLKNENSDLELRFRMEYYRYYKYMGNVPKMEHCLKELRTASFKYKFYLYYFQIWADMLQFYNVRGDTEYVRMQSLKMEEEATICNDKLGLAYAHLSMARSLVAAKKEEEAIAMFKKVFSIAELKPMTRVMVYSEIVTVYQEMGKNEESLRELEMQRSVLDKFVKDNPSQEMYCVENRLEMELNFCAAYNNMNDSSNLLKHLKEAEKCYTPDCFFSNYIGYHTYWGGYFRITSQWDKCFNEFDIALAHFDNTQPLYEMIVRRMKGKALVEAERYKEAAHLFKGLAIMKDSLNFDVVKLHQEALQANYDIRKALLEKESLEKRYNWTIVILVLLLGVVVLAMVLRAYKGRKALRCAEYETREALSIVDAANKLKEVFLHNITHQIREPLNVVVGFSGILATEKDLTQEQLKEYSLSIKRNADLLSKLIIDVLNLSRLESGMMKFNVSECNAVQICWDAKMAVEMHEHNKVKLSFETDVDSLNIRTDSGYFMKTLLSILASASGSEEKVEVKYTLSVEETNLKIVVKNSPLLTQSDDMQRIKHDINRLYLEIFNGTYKLIQEHNENNIVITYPLK